MCDTVITRVLLIMGEAMHILENTVNETPLAAARWGGGTKVNDYQYYDNTDITLDLVRVSPSSLRTATPSMSSLWRMTGMLMQLAAAVATQGTHRWKIGGDRYKRRKFNNLITIYMTTYSTIM